MLFGIASAPVAAQTAARPALQPVAILTVISGDVLMRAAGGDFRSAKDGAVLHVGTVLRTSADTHALITLSEGSTVLLDPASDVTIQDATARSGSTIAQSLGRGLRVVMHLTTADSRYEQTTPAATASVRGIEFEIAVVTGLGALPTTPMLMPTAHLVSPTVAIPTSVHVVAPTQTTTALANTTSVSARSTSRERVRRVLAQTLAPRATSAGRFRDRDEQDDREKD